jgi:hypothetical protein
MKTTPMLAYPNPFKRLDHQGVPAATYPFDPSHSPDRRWVGAAVDRSEGPDGLPRTRPLETEGDLTAVLPKGRLKGKLVNVDRAPRKRIQFAFNLAAPEKLPPPGPTQGHYLLGFREGSIIPGDMATALAAGVAFRDPRAVLRETAEAAIAKWKREHDEAGPDLSLWPANLLEAAGLAPEAKEPKGEEPAKAPAKGEPPAAAKEGEAPAAPEGDEAKDAAHGAGGGTA